MRQALGPGALGGPGGSGWGGRWEGGSGWGRHVNPRPFHFNVCQNSLQINLKKALEEKKKKKPRSGSFLYLLFGCTGPSLLHGLLSSCGDQGYSVVAVYGLLIAVTSLVVEQDCGYTGFGSCGSWDLKHRLNSCGAQA